MKRIVTLFFLPFARIAAVGGSNEFYSSAAIKARYLPAEVNKDRQVAEAVSILGNIKDTKYTSLALDAIAKVSDGNYAALTLEGYKGGPVDEQINQDRGVIVLAEDDDGKAIWIQAVWDGHGGAGHDVSGFCQTEVPKRIIQGIRDLDNSDGTNTTDKVSQLLIHVFEQVDLDVPEDTAYEGGATASLLLWYDNHFYMANAGDSQSWIGAYITRSDSTASTVHVVKSSRLDKPDDDDERERIIKAGGEVSAKSKDDDARVYYKSPKNGHSYGLAMSRAIGDRGATGVIPTPRANVWSLQELQQQVLDRFCIDEQSAKKDVQIETDGTIHADSDASSVAYNCTVSDIHFFAMSSSDGIIDFIQLEDMTPMIGEGFYNSLINPDVSLEDHPAVVLDYIIREAAAMWQKNYGDEYRDDIVLVASKFPPSSSSGAEDATKGGGSSGSSNPQDA